MEEDGTQYASEESRKRREPRTYAEGEPAPLTEEEAAEQMKREVKPSKRKAEINEPGIQPNQEAGGSYIPEANE